MTKSRQRVSLENEGDEFLSWQWLDQFSIEHGLTGRSQALEELFRSYQKQNEIILDRTQLSKEFATILKKQLDPVRIRTGYVDKNVRVMIELMNSYILLHQLEDQFPMTEVLTKPVAEAREKISTEIKAYQVAMKDKKDKHQTQGVADE